MFSILMNVLQKRDSAPMELDLPGIPSWLQEQEIRCREEFLQEAGGDVSSILLSLATIREQILPLRASLLFDDDGSAASAAVSALLERFENAPALLFTGSVGDDIARFCRDAEAVGRCCDSCVTDFGPLLGPGYPELLAVLRDESGDIITRLRQIAPAAGRYSTRHARVAELQRVHARLSGLAGTARAGEADEIRATSRIEIYRQQIAAIDADLEQIGTGPVSRQETEEAQRMQREIVQDTLAQSYREYAQVLHGITVRAGALSEQRGDDIAAGVFLILRQILDGKDVPGADDLFSALIDAFPIFMELIDDGALVLENDSERAVFTDVASFANGLQDICLCYHEMNANGSLLSVPAPQTSEERRQELSRERGEIMAKVMEESDCILRAHLLMSLTEEDGPDLVQEIEEGIREMTGRPVRIRAEFPVPLVPEDDGAGGEIPVQQVRISPSPGQHTASRSTPM